MSHLYFITHPEVHIAPNKEITSWSLSPVGRERVKKFAEEDVLQDIGVIFTSAERKAYDTAEIIGHQKQLNIVQYPGLEEIDRSATGYLPRKLFEDTVTEFFASPTTSVKGWETASHAQKRIVLAFEQICAITVDQSVVISSHGGVGALLLAFLQSSEISQQFDQTNLGNYFIVDKEARKVVQDWQPLPQI